MKHVTISIAILPQLRFGMLKAFIQNQDIADIEVEEKYVSFTKQERSDQYTTVWAPGILL